MFSIADGVYELKYTLEHSLQLPHSLSDDKHLVILSHSQNDDRVNFYNMTNLLKLYIPLLTLYSLMSGKE